jgi:sulfur-oxidizing protein SoxX
MRMFTKVAAAALCGAFILSSSALAADEQKEPTGKELAYNRSMGNCLACHAMPTQKDAISAGQFGPPLIAMSARFPDKAKLRAKIWDASVTNPNTSMPLFGKNKILTDAEIDKITDFVYGL